MNSAIPARFCLRDAAESDDGNGRDEDRLPAEVIFNERELEAIDCLQSRLNGEDEREEAAECPIERASPLERTILEGEISRD